MKKHLYILTFLAVGFAACGPTYVVQDPAPAPAPVPQPPPPPPQPGPSEVTYQNFYDDLSPYGQWIDDPNYGYVWLPDAGPDFKPYATNGHWVYTDEGWAWDSGYPWGWAAFHYGRWFFQDGYGWMWIPGNQWAPAWVSWRNSDEYYGWAPLGPNVSYGAAYGGGYAPPAHYWCFVPHQYIASPQVNSYYVRESNNVTIINRTTIINNTTVINNTRNVNYGVGPDPYEAGRYAGASIRPVSIRNGRNPGDRSDYGSFTVYRPSVNNSAVSVNRPGAPVSSGRQFAPTRVQTLGSVRPVNRTVYGGMGNNNGFNNDNRDYNNRWNNNNDNRGNNGNDNRGSNNGWNNSNDNRGNNNGWNNGRNNGNNWNNRGNNNGNSGNDNRGNDNRGNDNRGNDNRGNGNAWGRDVNGSRNQPVQNQPVPNSQPVQNNQAVPNNQSAPNNPFGRPFRPVQQPANNQPVNPNPVNRAAPQQPASTPANQPVQQQRPTFGRPAVMPPSRPVQQAATQQPRPVVDQPRPTPPPPPPPSQKKDDVSRPGRS